MDAVVPNFDELLRSLNHQLALYRQFMDVVRAERDCIVAVNVKELREHTYAKEAIIDEIQREENRRQFWLKEAARSLQLQPNELTMDIVTHRFAPERYEAMMSLKNTLVVMIKKTREANLENRKLVEIAMRDMQQMKKNILGITSTQPQTYGPKGSMGGSGPEKGARILSKEA